MWVPCKKNVYQKGEIVGDSDKKGYKKVKLPDGEVSLKNISWTVLKLIQILIYIVLIV